ncbi:hypothetical protein AQUCO_00500300v1 [Aquilegia coerulea]|uniref:C2H2-type domain-containing protein n=1 Tax=Aquilegia coerulea TaxID=218851 RepID=A0A2G5ER96_AQUCA|nr:hypothetical protein AQUCO_00500300v1 [Aquilegia coerulea]
MDDQEIQQQQQQQQHMELDGPSPSTSPSCEGEEEEEAGLKMNKNNLKRSEMGLKVKFKLGNNKDDQEKYVCKVCKKVFSSGKALGGHIRVHNLQVERQEEEVEEDDFDNEDDNQNLNQLKDKIKSKPKCYIKIPSSNPIKDNLDLEPTCIVCKKIFKSMKSLFGHMRCHPEREWRGINPPPNAVKNSEGSSSSSSSKELKLMGDSPNSFHIPKWTVKDKRGRKKLTCASPASDSSSDQLDEEIPEVVYNLMLLANGGEPLDSSLTIKHRSNEESKMKNRRWSEESESSTPLKKLKMEEFDKESRVNDNDFSLGKKKKTKLWKDLESSPRVGVVMEMEYKCLDCNKSFATHQALGGHRSSHMKFNAPLPTPLLPPPPQSEEEVAVNNNDMLESLSDDHVMGSTSGSKQQQQQTHKCQICNKTFSTGQALGGHKRCHWNGHLPATIEAQAPIATPPPPATTTATSSVASQDDEEAAASRNVLDFDLNELPAMEEEEEEPTDLDYPQVQAQAHTHASFFYNSAT